MFDRHAGDTFRGYCPEYESLHLGIVGRVLYDAVADIFLHYDIARCLHVFWLAYQDAYAHMREPGTEITEPGMLFVRIIAIYYIVVVIESDEHCVELGRVCLHVIVHEYDHVALSIMQSTYQSIVLTDIVSERDCCYTVKISGESFELAGGRSSVRRKIIDQNKLIWSPAQPVQFRTSGFHDLTDRM